MVRKLTALGRGNLRLRSAARSSSTPIDAEAPPSEAPPKRAGGFGRSPGIPDSSNQRRLSQRLINRIHHRRGPPPPEPNEDDAIGASQKENVGNASRRGARGDRKKLGKRSAQSGGVGSSRPSSIDATGAGDSDALDADGDATADTLRPHSPVDGGGRPRHRSKRRLGRSDGEAEVLEVEVQMHDAPKPRLGPPLEKTMPPRGPPPPGPPPSGPPPQKDAKLGGPSAPSVVVGTPVGGPVGYGAVGGPFMFSASSSCAPPLVGARTGGVDPFPAVPPARGGASSSSDGGGKGGKGDGGGEQGGKSVGNARRRPCSPDEAVIAYGKPLSPIMAPPLPPALRRPELLAGDGGSEQGGTSAGALAQSLFPAPRAAPPAVPAPPPATSVAPPVMPLQRPPPPAEQSSPRQRPARFKCEEPPDPLAAGSKPTPFAAMEGFGPASSPLRAPRAAIPLPAPTAAPPGGGVAAAGGAGDAPPEGPRGDVLGEAAGAAQRLADAAATDGHSGQRRRRRRRQKGPGSDASESVASGFSSVVSSTLRAPSAQQSEPGSDTSESVVSGFSSVVSRTLLAPSAQQKEHAGEAGGSGRAPPRRHGSGSGAASDARACGGAVAGGGFTAGGAGGFSAGGAGTAEDEDECAPPSSARSPRSPRSPRRVEPGAVAAAAHSRLGGGGRSESGVGSSTSSAGRKSVTFALGEAGPVPTCSTSRLYGVVKPPPSSTPSGDASGGGEDGMAVGVAGAVEAWEAAELARAPRAAHPESSRELLEKVQKQLRAQRKLIAKQADAISSLVAERAAAVDALGAGTAGGLTSELLSSPAEPGVLGAEHMPFGEPLPVCSPRWASGGGGGGGESGQAGAAGSGAGKGAAAPVPMEQGVPVQVGLPAQLRATFPAWAPETLSTLQGAMYDRLQRRVGGFPDSAASSSATGSCRQRGGAELSEEPFGGTLPMNFKAPALGAAAAPRHPAASPPRGAASPRRAGREEVGHGWERLSPTDGASGLVVGEPPLEPREPRVRRHRRRPSANGSISTGVSSPSLLGAPGPATPATPSLAV